MNINPEMHSICSSVLLLL